MTCYMRHMHWLFEAVETAYDADGRKRMDAALRRVLGFGPQQHCPEIWAAVKALSPERRSSLVGEVRQALAATARDPSMDRSP